MQHFMKNQSYASLQDQIANTHEVMQVCDQRSHHQVAAYAMVPTAVYKGTYTLIGEYNKLFSNHLHVHGCSGPHILPSIYLLRPELKSAMTTITVGFVMDITTTAHTLMTIAGVSPIYYYDYML